MDEGEREALFQELYQYYRGVLSLAKRLGFSPDDARDLAQDVYCRVYQHMDEYRGESKWGYLERITRRLAYNRIRDQHAAKRAVNLGTEDELDTVVDHRNRPADDLIDLKQKTALLYNAVEQLDEKMRSAMKLYLADLSYDEIGKVLGISQAALKSRLNAARTRMKELLGADFKRQSDDP